MKKIIVLFIIVATLLVACKNSLRKEMPAATISSAAYPLGNGWGYRVFINKKIFIQQDFIPAVSGKRSFPTKAAAESVAALVMQKMEQHQKPFVTEEELEKMGIN
jgi:hypothetical protein